MKKILLISIILSGSRLFAADNHDSPVPIQEIEIINTLSTQSLEINIPRAQLLTSAQYHSEPSQLEKDQINKKIRKIDCNLTKQKRSLLIALAKKEGFNFFEAQEQAGILPSSSCDDMRNFLDTYLQDNFSLLRPVDGNQKYEIWSEIFDRFHGFLVFSTAPQTIYKNYFPSIYQFSKNLLQTDLFRMRNSKTLNQLSSNFFCNNTQKDEFINKRHVNIFLGWLNRYSTGLPGDFSEMDYTEMETETKKARDYFEFISSIIGIPCNLYIGSKEQLKEKIINENMDAPYNKRDRTMPEDLREFCGAKKEAIEKNIENFTNQCQKSQNELNLLKTSLEPKYSRLMCMYDYLVYGLLYIRVIDEELDQVLREFQSNLNEKKGFNEYLDNFSNFLAFYIKKQKNVGYTFLNHASVGYTSLETQLQIHDKKMMFQNYSLLLVLCELGEEKAKSAVGELSVNEEDLNNPAHSLILEDFKKLPFEHFLLNHIFNAKEDKKESLLNKLLEERKKRVEENS